MLLHLVLALQLTAQADPWQPLLASAKTLVDQLVSGDTASVAAQFNDQMKAALNEERVKQTMTAVTAQAGAFKSQTATRTQQAQGNFRVVVVVCAFEKATVDVTVVFDTAGKVAGLSLRPAAPPAVEYSPPSYAKPGATVESALTVDAGGWPLPATLTLPAGAGPFPAVVLVHGSGPNDRDETVGANKPFKDLALGLASNGIGVLRYEKRTRVHTQRTIGITTFTVEDETVADALAAAALLRKTPGVNPAQVFVLGHSLGGMLAPRIGARDSQLAGLVILAGATEPLEDAIVRQTRYIANLDGTIDAAEQKQIDAMAAMAKQVKALKPGDKPIATPPFSAPVSYFLDLRAYAPPEVAKLLKQPMLILQGERDYQVTMNDFAAWQKALAGRPNVTFKSYPALNHLFIEGSGPGNPQEYSTASHVSPTVIADITQWVLKQRQ
jgi:uncharacterized protein